MKTPFFMEEIGADGVAWITLTRADTHNTLNDQLVQELTGVLKGMADDPRVRILILTARGPTFCGGADLNWMRAMADYSHEENLSDARALAELMQVLDDFPKPTLAMVQGNVYGGGVGLVCCCDVAIAVAGVYFRLSEVRFGLVPAVIGPYVLRAIGARQARRYFLTAESIATERALEIGLVHQVVPGDMLAMRVDNVAKCLLAGGPRALAQAKELIARVDGAVLDEALREETARMIADLRASEEGVEGVRAFLEKRDPEWMGD